MCILHIQKNKDGIVLFEIVILIYSIDYKVVFRAAHIQIRNYTNPNTNCHIHLKGVYVWICTGTGIGIIYLTDKSKHHLHHHFYIDSNFYA